MKEENKEITLIGTVEPRKKEYVFEADRARRMHAYNHAIKRLVHNR